MNEQSIEKGSKQEGKASGEADVLAISSVPTVENQDLAPHELNTLKHCEEILRKGLDTFFEVGKALLTIREGRLYRFSHHTFEDYCHDRWEIGRSHASRLIGAAERLRLLSPQAKFPWPCNEFQIRPFLRLEPAEFPKMWEQAVARAGDGRVTFYVAEEVVSEIAPKARKRKLSRSRRRRFSEKCLPGEVLALLHQVKRKIDQNEKRAALEIVERIESLLFAM